MVYFSVRLCARWHLGLRSWHLSAEGIALHFTFKPVLVPQLWHCFLLNAPIPRMAVKRMEPKREKHPIICVSDLGM